MIKTFSEFVTTAPAFIEVSVNDDVWGNQKNLLVYRSHGLAIRAKWYT